jgi:hypothetical protein
MRCLFSEMRFILLNYEPVKTPLDSYHCFEYGKLAGTTPQMIWNVPSILVKSESGNQASV